MLLVLNSFMIPNFSFLYFSNNARSNLHEIGFLSRIYHIFKNKPNVKNLLTGHILQH